MRNFNFAVMILGFALVLGVSNARAENCGQVASTQFTTQKPQTVAVTKKPVQTDSKIDKKSSSAQ